MYLVSDPNKEDTDGDGWDDAYENNYKSKGFDKNKWNVGDRDLAITAELIYRNRDELSKLGTDYSDILKKTNLGDLDLNISDKRFFENWDFLSGSFREEQYGQYLPFANKSTVAAFRNKSTGDIIISYRGTDEGVAELGRDSLIALNLDSVKNLAGKQISDILNELGYIGKLYITGHSLGGYEAYHGAIKVLTGLVNFADKFSKVVNFNGPGFNKFDSKYKESQRFSDKFVSYNTVQWLNDLIVHGPGNLLHPGKVEKIETSYTKNSKFERVNPIYSHMLTSLFNDKKLNQGKRDSRDKFDNPMIKWFSETFAGKLGSKLLTPILNAIFDKNM